MDARKDYLTIDEVAKTQGCSRRTVFRLISARGVKTVKIPGDRRTLLRKADADALFRPIVGEPRRHR
jgi:excisionase family DNA binding protein